MAWTNENQPGLWAGYNFFGPMDTNKYVATYLLFFGEQSEAERALQIFDDLVDREEGIFWIQNDKSNHESFMDWHGPTTDAVGGNNFLSSRLIQQENLATEEAKNALTQALLAAGGGLFNHIGGKGVIEGDPNRETSVTPAWRQAVSHFVLTGSEASPADNTKEGYAHAM